MIEQFLSENSRCALVLRPRRAMTKTQFVGLFVVIAMTTWAVAILSYVIGNVFAPAFALLDCVFVAIALRWVWLSSNRVETIELGASTTGRRGRSCRWR